MGAELLRTARLVLRELTDDDLADLVALDADPEVTRFVSGGNPTPPEVARERLTDWIAMYDRTPGLGFWAAEDPVTREFLGWFHLRPSADTGEPELGYRLRRSAWGRGLATEGCRALIDRAFTTTDAPRIIARTLAVNDRSRRVMEKCGMRPVRAFHGNWPIPIPGDEHGDVEYAITREEWATRGPGLPNTLLPMPERPSWFDPTVMPFESRWLELDGHTLHYVDEGSGPPLLLVHGNPSWSFLYRRMIPALSDRFRCVAVDHPGFGLSRARPGYGFTASEHSDVMRGFVAALDLTGITAVVQDWGGPIALGAAVAEPDRYAALVVGNTWAWPSNLWTRCFGAVMGGPVTGPLLNQRLNLLAGTMLPRMMRRRALTARERAMYAGPFPTAESRAPARILASQISGAAPFLRDLEARLPAISDLPTLLLWATGDIAFGDGERTRWQGVLSNRTDHTLEGAGHFWPDDAAEEAAGAIRDWLATRGTR